MDRKLLNTIILLSILIVILIAGVLYCFVYQSGEIDIRMKELNELEKTKYDTNELLARRDSLNEAFIRLDSIISARKFNIPMALSQSKFYDFVTNATSSFSEHSFANVEYEKSEKLKDFNVYSYKLSGTATYSDMYKLIYAVEQSKELKKISQMSLNDFVKVDDDNVPYFLVNFTMSVEVLYAENDRFSSKDAKENNLVTSGLYDAFFPLIRTEIPPNINNLFDAQTGKLLAILPDGALLTDASGQSFMLWEGDEVYLGYLTEIDFNKKRATFILNKGGLIEKEVLSIDDVQNKNEKRK